MTKTNTHAQNLANMAENRIKVALEADSQQKLVSGATTIETCKTYVIVEDTLLDSQMLDWIYADEPLWFEKVPLTLSTMPILGMKRTYL